MISATVIITTFNRAQFFLSRAIESVLAQESLFSFEILVVDDNGINTKAQLATQLVCKDYIEQNKIVYIPLSKNSGACIARNKGIEYAIGEYIFFLDDDDLFLPNKIQTQVVFLNNRTDLDGCLAAFKRIGENQLEIKGISNFPFLGDLKKFAIAGNFFTPMLCIRKHSLLKMGGFYSIDRFQDRYMMLHAIAHGLKFECLNVPLHVMYEHNGDRITNGNITKTINSLNIIKNFIGKYQTLFTMAEWNAFLENDLRMRGIAFYMADSYLVRIKGFGFFFKAFKFSRQLIDFKMALKSILKV